jgi:hypothetical protein
MAFLCGCGGNGGQYHEQYERLKTGVIDAPDAAAEADALARLRDWARRGPIGVTLAVASQPENNGVNVDAMRPGEAVEVGLYAKSDYEPRGGFSFLPKDKRNLLLFQRGGSGSSAGSSP